MYRNYFSGLLPVDKAEKLDATSSSQSQTTAVTKAILDSLEVDTMHESWQTALQHEFKKPYFTKVMDANSLHYPC